MKFLKVIKSALCAHMILFSTVSALRMKDIEPVFEFVHEKYWGLIPTPLIKLNTVLENLEKYARKNCFSKKLINTLFDASVPGDLALSNNKKFLAYYLDEKTIGLIIGCIEKYLAGEIVNNANSLLDALTKLITEDLKNVPDINIYITDTGKQIPHFAEAIVGSLKECGHFNEKKPLFPSDVTLKILQAFIFIKMTQKEQIKKYLDAIEEQLGAKIYTNNMSLEEKETASVDTIEIIKKVKEGAEKKAESYDLIPFLKSLDISFETFFYAITIRDFFSKDTLPTLIKHNFPVKYNGHSFRDCAEVMLRNFFNIIIFTEKSISLETFSEDIKKFYKDRTLFTLINEKEEADDDWVNNVVENLPLITYCCVSKKDVSGEEKTYGKYKNEKIMGFLYGIDDISGLTPESITLFGDSKSFHKITINGQKFIHVSADEVNNGNYILYEVAPTLKNVIIMFHLKSKKFKIENIQKAYASEKFCHTYFAQLCKLVGWSLQKNSTSDLDGDKNNVVAYIQTEHGAFSINTEIKPDYRHGYVKKESGCKMNDEFSKLIAPFAFKEGAKNSDMFSFGEHTIKEIIDNSNKQQTMNYLFLMQQLDSFDRQINLIKEFLKIEKINNNFIQEILNSLIASLPIEDLSYHIRLVDAIDPAASQNKALTNSIFDSAKKALINYINNKNNNNFTNALCLCKSIIKNGSKTQYTQVFNHVQNITTAQKCSSEGVLDILMLLYDKGPKQVKDVVVKQALILVKDKKNGKSQQAAFKTLDELIKKDNGTAIKAIKKFIETYCTFFKDNFDEQTAGLKLLKLLVDNKPEEIDFAINIATKGVLSKNDDVLCNLLNLFAMFVNANKEQTFDNAINVATEVFVCQNMVNKEDNIYQLANNIFNTLVKTEKRYVVLKKALEAALKIIEHGCVSEGDDQYDYFDAGLTLLTLLIENDKKTETIKEVLAGVKKLVDQKFPVIRIKALRILRSLIEKYYKETVDVARFAAEKIITGKYWLNRDSNDSLEGDEKIAFDLLKILLEKKDKDAFKIAVNIVQDKKNPVNAIKQMSQKILQSALPVTKSFDDITGDLAIFMLLVDANYEPAFEVAIQEASLAIGNNDPNIQQTALLIFKKMFALKHAKAFVLAESVLQNGISNEAVKQLQSLVQSIKPITKAETFVTTESVLQKSISNEAMKQSQNMIQSIKPVTKIDSFGYIKKSTRSLVNNIREFFDWNPTVKDLNCQF